MKKQLANKNRECGRHFLRFATGEYFVGSNDLHDTTWTADRSEATIYPTQAAAQQMADAMARTQGVKMNVS